MTFPDLAGFLDDPSLTLHFLAYDKSPKALETVKFLLDNGKLDVNLKEGQDFLTPLHIAAHWDNLAMCQLLLHYGADPLAFSKDDQCPIDLATGKAKEFLQKLCNKRGQKKKQRKILKFIRHVFQPHKTKPTPDDRIVRPPSAPPAFFARLDGQEPITEKVFSAVAQYNERLSNGSGDTFWTATEGRGRTFSVDSRRSFFSATQSNRNSMLITGETFSTNNIALNLTPKVEPTAPPFSPDSTPVASHRTVHIGQGDQTPRPVPRQSSLLDGNVTKRMARSKPLKDDATEIKADAGPMWESGKKSFASTPTEVRDPEKNSDENVPIYTEMIPKPKPRNASLFSDLSNDQTKEHVLIETVKDLKKLQLHQLRAKLLKEGVLVGPLDDHNRYLYEMKLAKVLYRQEQQDKDSLIEKLEDSTISEGKYSRQLMRMMNVQNVAMSEVGLEELRIVNHHFKKAEIVDSSYFVYLLIDPTTLNEDPTFVDFVDSVFYVGKGKYSRSHFHMNEAIEYKNDNKGKKNMKCQRIIDIWGQNRGIKVLHAFSNVNSDHAFIFEGAIMTAIGMPNLTNKKGGEFKRPTDRFTQREKESLGARLVYNSYCIFQNTITTELTEAMVVPAKSP